MIHRACFAMFFALAITGACTSDDDDGGGVDAAVTSDATTGDTDGNGNDMADAADQTGDDAATTCQLGCVTVSGSWQIKGDCGANNCMIFQTGCSIQFSCTDGASFTGTICGNEIAYGGETSEGDSIACAGTIAGNTMTGTCEVGGKTCSFVNDR